MREPSRCLDVEAGIAYPKGDIYWRSESGWLFGLHDTANILLPRGNEGAGIWNESSVLGGYSTKSLLLSGGLSLAQYFIAACNAALTCGRTLGIAPGFHVQAHLFLSERFGALISGGVAWASGTSGPLHDTWTGTIVIGPVLRWEEK
ncbi:MAG: hypothetical protein U0441_00905 [Polyangiaceae bacterium]